MKKMYPLLAILVFSLVLPALTTSANAAESTTSGTIVIALDLAHGQSSKLVSDLVNLSVPGVVFRVFGTYEGLESLGDTIASDALSGVDVLIFGEINKPLSDEEITAVKSWLDQGNKVLWIAGDSDYGSSGVARQEQANMLAERVGTHLRIDLVSVEDPVSNCGAGYRVAAVVPDEAPELVKLGITRPVLSHGPGVVAYVDDNGNWKSLKLGEATYPDNVFPLLATTANGTIVNNNDPEGNVYEIGDTGRFPIVAAEKLSSGSIVIVSGASPYGDYMPFIATEYYGVALDGPRFVENTLTWSLVEAGIIKVLLTAEDESNDELYQYPTNEVFVNGLFDLISFVVFDDGTNYIFKIGVKELGGNPWNGPNGFSLQYFTIYINTKDGGNTSGVPGSNIQISDDLAWEYAITITPGWESYIENPNSGNGPTALWLADGTVKTDIITVSASDGSDTILVSVPKSELGDLENAGFIVTLGGHDGFGVKGYRPVSTEAEEWKFGGADSNWIIKDIAPRVVDVLPGGKDVLKPVEDKVPVLKEAVPKKAAPAPTGGLSPAIIAVSIIVVIIVAGIGVYMATRKE
ncbi:MAG: hypothetical protein J7J75_04160 [Euryarchaeota archaeon]|nr:hypothetical protein [Euryarchaeota archaeon]